MKELKIKKVFDWASSKLFEPPPKRVLISGECQKIAIWWLKTFEKSVGRHPKEKNRPCYPSPCFLFVQMVFADKSKSKLFLRKC